MKKSIILIAATICCFAAACKKDNQLVEPVTQAAPALSLAQVQDWYNHQPALSTQANLQTFSLRKLPMNWDKAESFGAQKGNYWLLSLPGQPTYQGVKQGYRKIAFMKDSTGRVAARILEIIPDALYYQRKQKAETKDFTGRVFIFDQAYHLLGGKILINGKQAGQITPRAPGSNSAKLQTNMVQVYTDCSWYDSSYFDAEGVFTVHSEQICSATIYDDGFYPDTDGGGVVQLRQDPLGGGGGGGGEAASAPDPSNLPGEDQSKINPQDYVRCFGSISSTGATMSVTLYVVQPMPGTFFNVGPNAVGHTAIGLTKTNGSQSITQTVGYYPDATGKSRLHAPSKVVDNTDLPYNLSITYNVSAAQFQGILDYINTPPAQYDLEGFNCTSFAYEALLNGGVTPPNPYSTVYALGPSNAGQVMTPAGLGDSIAAMKGQPGVNSNGGTIGKSHGPCN